MKDQKVSDDLYQVVVDDHIEYTNEDNYTLKAEGKVFASWYGAKGVPKSLKLATPKEPIDKGAKYKKTIRDRTTGDTIKGDVYDVLEAFNVTCPAMQHAIKKLLMPGERGSKGYDKDCDEGINSVEQSKLLQKFRK